MLDILHYFPHKVLPQSVDKHNTILYNRGVGQRNGPGGATNTPEPGPQRGSLYGHHQCSVRTVQDRGRRLPHPRQRARGYSHGDSRWRIRRRGRGLRLRVRSLCWRFLKRVVLARSILPRRQDRLSGVGHEEWPYQPKRGGSLRPRHRRVDGVIVVAPRVGSYEERTCMRCFEGRVYDMERGAWVACERCSDTGLVTVYLYPKLNRRSR